MLGSRVLVSAILIPSLATAFWLDARLGDTAPLLFGLCVALALRSTYELTRLLRTETRVPSPALTGCCNVVLIGATWLPHTPLIAPRPDSPELLMPAFICSVLVLLLAGALRYREPGRSMDTLGAELIIVAYVGLLLSITAQLRWVAGANAGYIVLGSLVISAKCGDIGAYTLGRLLGRRKMVPRLSPGKTWMGGLGALAGGGLGALAWLTFATPAIVDEATAPAWYVSLLYGALIGLTGLIGDLSESLIKRDVGVKDSASFLPGFGGLLDLLDSVLYAGPIAWLLWHLLPLATWNGTGQ